MTTRARVLILPGFGNSGPDHWQTLWETRYGYERVPQDDWEHPTKDAWVSSLARAVDASKANAVVVAHSLGCVALAHFARQFPTSRVVGALCVAPADVDSEMHTPDDVRCFSPLPLERLPFPSLLVASRIDPYIRFQRAQSIAEAWGSRLVDVGRLGHINADSGVGAWPEGHQLLEELLAGREAPQPDKTC